MHNVASIACVRNSFDCCHGCLPHQSHTYTNTHSPLPKGAATKLSKTVATSARSQCPYPCPVMRERGSTNCPNSRSESSRTFICPGMTEALQVSGMTLTFNLQGNVTIELTDPINTGVSKIRILLCCLEVSKLGFLEF